jgi:hypothetical protein
VVRFVDYLYVSVTNVMALPTTDTTLLALWAKVLMTLHAMVAALRAKMLDDRILASPQSTPMPWWCTSVRGRDSVVFRVDPPPTVDRYSVDLPAVIR